MLFFFVFQYKEIRVQKSLLFFNENCSIILNEKQTDQQTSQGEGNNGKVHPDHINNEQFIVNLKTKIMKKNLMMFAMIFIVTVSTIFLVGCKKDNVLNESINSGSQEINFAPKMAQKDIDRILKQPIKVTDPTVLEELQFMRDQKMISEQFYEVLIRMTMPQKIGPYESYPGCYESFCDATYSREGIRNLMKDHKNLSGELTLKDHRRHTYMYSSTGGTIVLRVKTAGSAGVPTAEQVPTTWVTALNSAVADWNALGHKVKFSVITAANNTNPSGYVNISRQAIVGNLLELARAEYPQSANSFGSYIYINSQYVGPNTTVAARRYAMAHELGHIIGLRHTDDSSDPYGSWVDNSISCYGSTSYTDPSSIFRSTVSATLSSWPGFSSCDNTVVNYYW